MGTHLMTQNNDPLVGHTLEIYISLRTVGVYTGQTMSQYGTVGSVQGLHISLMILFMWTVTSFLCHFMGKQFLIQMDSLSDVGRPNAIKWSRQLFSAFFLTVVQMAFCSVLVRLRESSPIVNQTARVSHALASFATNLSMATTFASSTFAIKMMEPITSAVIQFIILGKPLSQATLLSLPLIVGGAIIFTGDTWKSPLISIGTVMALTSNVLLSFRNIALKQVTSSGMPSMTFSPKGRQLHMPASFLVMTFCVAIYLETVAWLPTRTTFVLLLATLSAFFHVAYSYVSTGIVLSQLSVVSHAVTNIFKRALVVLLLYAFGQRYASGLNFLGLLGCALGLMIYAYNKTQDDGVAPKNSPTSMCRKSVCLILIVTCLTSFVAVSYVQCKALKTQNPNVLLRKDATINTHAFRGTFTHHGLKRPSEYELLPVSNISSNVSQFLKRRLANASDDANYLSKHLQTADDIIRESQRIHFNMLGDALKQYKYAMLFDIASFENKGDPCITVGEIYFLRRMNIEIVYYCNFYACIERNMDKAKIYAEQYDPNELVILVHGGGNIVGYANNDIIRFKLLQRFPTYRIFVFPQSIWIRNMNNPHVKRTIDNYCCHPNLTIVLRDSQSYDIAKRIYKGASRLLLAPDMAFQIGRVERFMSPVFDILWLKRADGESPGYRELQAVPKHLRVHISDWWKWLTPAAGSSLEKAFYISANGFFFLQRGRVIVTDRLHGHILSTLMDIPHVLIDNKAKKLSSYHNTWTRSLNNTVITERPEEALNLAINLLERFNDTLPPIIPHLDISEHFAKKKLGVPIVHYP